MNVTPLSSCEAKLPLRLLYAGIDGINLTRFECLNIGVGRFRILGGGQGLEYWGGGGTRWGQIPSIDVISTSCAHKVFNKSVPNNYISHLKI